MSRDISIYIFEVQPMRTLFTFLLLIPAWAMGSEPARYSTKEIPVAKEVRLAPEQKRTLFIGHYGETLNYSEFWVLHSPVLMDGIEVIRFHTAWFEQLPWHRKAINDSDFNTLDNYTPLQLVQLLVIPKNNKGFKDLTSLREAKEQDLRAKGYSFEIQDAPAPFNSWPANTFQVFVSTPYRIHQLYVESDGRLFILTGGLDEADEVVAEWQKLPGINLFFKQDFINSLWSYFDKLRSIDTKKNEPADLSALQRVCLPLTAVGLLLFGIPWAKKYTRPLASAAIVAAISGGMLDIIAFYGARWLVGIGWERLVSPGILGWSSMPLLLGVLFYRSRKLGTAQKWVVRGVSLFATVLLALDAYAIQHGPQSSTYSTASEFSLFMFWVGLLYGFCLGLLIKPAQNLGKNIVLPVLFFFSVLAPGPILAQTDQASADRAEAIRRLNEMPLQKMSELASVHAQLNKDRLLNDIQRVELDGIIATDKTPAKYQKYFDLHLQPAHNNAEASTPVESGSLLDRIAERVRSGLKKANNDRKDISDLFDDKTGELTARGRETLGPLTDINIHVNEIVAHSWGAVLLHNAIEAGFINPPKRIIVIGVPDGDLHKWEMLAKYTGTDVVIVQNTRDLPVASAKAADVINDIDIRGGSKRYSEGKIVRGWDKWAQTHPQADVSGSYEEKTVTLNRLGNLTGHERVEYYEALIRLKLMVLDKDQMKSMQDDAENNLSAEIREKYIQGMIRQIEFVRAQDASVRQTISNQKFLDNQRKASQLPPMAVQLPPQLVAAPLPAQAPRDRYWQAKAYRNLAIKACQAPPNITQADFNAIGPYPTSSDIFGFADISANLSGCARFVFDRMISANRAGEELTSPILIQWAADFQSSQNTRSYVPPHHTDDEGTDADGCSGGEDQWHPRHCPGKR